MLGSPFHDRAVPFRLVHMVYDEAESSDLRRFCGSSHIATRRYTAGESNLPLTSATPFTSCTHLVKARFCFSSPTTYSTHLLSPCGCYFDQRVEPVSRMSAALLQVFLVLEVNPDVVAFFVVKRQLLALSPHTQLDRSRSDALPPPRVENKDGRPGRGRLRRRRGRRARAGCQRGRNGPAIRTLRAG